MADFWLFEKQLIHKLFKVLAPRYENSQSAFTRLLRAPRPYPGWWHKKAILELKGNPFPPLRPDHTNNRNLIHNVLLDEARKQYRTEKYAEIAAKIDSEASKIARGEKSGSAEISGSKSEERDVEKNDISEVK